MNGKGIGNGKENGQGNGRENSKEGEVSHGNKNRRETAK